MIRRPHHGQRTAEACSGGSLLFLLVPVDGLIIAAVTLPEGVAFEVRANRLLQGLGIRLQGVIIGVEDRLIILIVQLNQISYGPLESHGLRIFISCSLLGLIFLGGRVLFKRGLLVV